MSSKSPKETLKEKLKAEYEALDPSQSNVLLEDIYLNLSLMSLDDDKAKRLLCTPDLLKKMLSHLLDDDELEHFLISKLHCMANEFAMQTFGGDDVGRKGESICQKK